MPKLLAPSFFLTMVILFLDLGVVSVSALASSHVRRVDHRKINLSRLSTTVEPSVTLRRRKTCKNRSKQATMPTASLPGTSSGDTSASTATTSLLPVPTQPAQMQPIVGKPSNWPTATQVAAAPTATVTSPSDPLLKELSKSYNNTENPLYNTIYTGDMTFYSQGLGACGDTYNDTSFTAAVSMTIFDAWPGASAAHNRNPLCGPFSPGRKIISLLGTFVTAIAGTAFVNVGGDGMLNCDSSAQCHVPLTATVTHGSMSIQVQIVDRCVACKRGDIDLTPAAFQALADPALGRTSATWFFNKY